MTIGVRQLKTGLNKVMGRNLIALVSKTCGHRQADSGRIKPGSETVNNPDPDSFRPQNPKQTRPQPPVERGWADKADSRPPLRGPGGWGGDWYIWHAPDGLRARAATGRGCVQAGAQQTRKRDRDEETGNGTERETGQETGNGKPGGKRDSGRETGQVRYC